MLLELHVENFAIIDRLDASFGPGFAALTGETGAGKSIVVDAISAAVGERVGVECIRHDADEALIQAAFDVSGRTEVLELLRAADLEPEDGTVVLSRTVSREGRNRARINGRVVTLSTLKQVGDLLVDICGQHEHQSLTTEARHVDLLDALGDEEHLALLSQVAAAYQQVRALRERLCDLRVSERDRAQRLDLLRFQVREIEALDPRPGEEETLGHQRRRLANAERLHELAGSALARLAGETRGGQSVAELLGEVQTAVAQGVALDPGLQPVLAGIQEANVLVQDAAERLRAYLDGIDFDPQALEEVESRLAAIARLKRKYGDSIEEMLAYRKSAAAELADLQEHDLALERIESELAGAEKNLGMLAVALSDRRQALAKRLVAAVTRHLRDLGMQKVTFHVAIEREDAEDGIPLPGGARAAVSARGADRVRFLISTNPGEPPGPLARIASGGELSRVMLAIKSCLSAQHDIPTLIFDEIDSGIGGRTAAALGEKLSALAVGRQVLAVTHLPAIAVIADAHHVVTKASGKRAQVGIEVLGDEQRVDEVARMLGAEERGSVGRRHAQEMVEQGRARRLAVRQQSSSPE
jgi:DNA repair protein RecN (Recombination protein N)